MYLNFVPTSASMPDPSAKRGRFSSKWLMLANDEDYLGLGELVQEAGKPEVWRLQTGQVLALQEVTQWATLLKPTLFGSKRPPAQEALFDEDGYPTTYALRLVEAWGWNDPLGWFQFVKKLWQHVDRGVKQETRKEGTQVELHCLGWSGNEAVVRSMMRNDSMWEMYWTSSVTGGHYQFFVKAEDEDEEGEKVAGPAATPALESGTAGTTRTAGLEPKG